MDSHIRNLIEDYFYDEYGSTIHERIFDEVRNTGKIEWAKINPDQYARALSQYMQYGDAMRFPERIIDEWIGIIIRNIMKLQAITDIAGHSSCFHSDTFEDSVYGEEYEEWYNSNEENQEKEYLSYDSISDFLDEVGFYDACTLPDGSDAWSDYGLPQYIKVLEDTHDGMSVGEKLVTVNRLMDVIHCRGDLASMFIEGGSRTLSDISDGSYVPSVNEGRSGAMKDRYKRAMDKIRREKYRPERFNSNSEWDEFAVPLQLGWSLYDERHTWIYPGTVIRSIKNLVSPSGEKVSKVFIGEIIDIEDGPDGKVKIRTKDGREMMVLKKYIEHVKNNTFTWSKEDLTKQPSVSDLIKKYQSNNEQNNSEENITEMKKNDTKVRLNAKQFKSLVRECVKRALMENVMEVEDGDEDIRTIVYDVLESECLDMSDEFANNDDIADLIMHIYNEAVSGQRIIDIDDWNGYSIRVNNTDRSFVSFTNEDGTTGVSEYGVAQFVNPREPEFDRYEIENLLSAINQAWFNCNNDEDDEWEDDEYEDEEDF